MSAHETQAIPAARAAEALASTPHVGRSVAHEAAELHVTGAALYTDDLAVRTGGVLAAWPVCAPHASAWLDHLDTSPALAVPGVVRVLTAADVPGTNDTGPSRLDEPFFPRASGRGATPPAPLPDAAATAASVPPSNYRPVLAGYRAAPSDVDAMPWRQANDQAAAIGGWRAYAREAQPPQPAASGAAAPAGRGAR